jgi:hypothetical protein
MHASAGDTLFLVIPFIAILVMGFFRLDELLFASSGKEKRTVRRPRFANVEQDGETLVDPDGRVTRRKGPEAELPTTTSQRRSA